MALIVKDRVRQTTSTTGTGPVTLDGTVTGFQDFSVIGDGNTTYYAIVLDTEWEVGLGTYTASGTTLSRDVVLESSNSGNLVNFSGGAKDVFVTYPAERSVYVDGSSIVPAVAATLPAVSGGTGLSSVGATGNVLTSDGTNWVSSAPTPGTRFSAGTTGFTPSTLSSGDVTLAGTLVAANGGTGQSSYAVGDLLYASGSTALSKLAGVATGNVLLSGGVATAPSWGKVGLTTHVSGTLAIGNGGTGVTGTPTNGQLLIGNGSGYTLATVTAGTGISVTNGAGSISIAATNNGTVTSVATGTGLTGGPITSSGTVSVATNGITDALLRQSAGLSVIGRSTSTTGDVADITAGSDHQVFRRSGTSVGFGAVALNQANAVTGTLPVGNGGTGATSLTANNVLLGNGTSALQVVAPGTSGNVLTSDGTTWISQQPTGGDPRVLTPTNVSPANSTTDVIETPTLTASAFFSLYGATHSASQWQVSTVSNFSSTVVSTGDIGSLTSYTVSAGVLSTNTLYYWRVRYKNSLGDYSDWSTATTFTTAMTFVTFIEATGGTVTTDGDYKVHTFTANGTFTVTTVGSGSGESNTVQYLVVAGGGGGGTSIGGAGGAGGYRTATGFTVTAQAYSITVGGGGAGSTRAPPNGVAGSNSVFSTITSAGGGAGGGEFGGPAGSGGSGGGGCRGGGGGAGNTPSTSPSQGNNGGAGSTGPGTSGGGGGGAGGAGGTGGSNVAGARGPGTASTISGSSVTYSTGGLGSTFGSVGPAGAANRGEGGGGGANAGNATNGGSGIVIIRYRFQ